MRLLHTSDWHVGKQIRGQSRADEHRAVLAEITSIAAAEAVDVVLVAGDLFETAAPGPESESIVYRTLLDLAAVAPVIVVAGNHDNPRRLAAVTPLLDLGRVTLLSEIARPDDGGVVDVDVDGVTLRAVLVPFVSKRGIVRADALMDIDAYQRSQAYDDRMRMVIASLTNAFTPDPSAGAPSAGDPSTSDRVNIVVGHIFAAGGTLGGGERSAHTIMEYSVSAQAFGVAAQYVALGHLHRAQDIAGPTRIRYCGSPLQLDFGEERQDKSVTIVDVEPGAPAAVREVPLTSGRRMRTLRGTLAELDAAVDTTGDDYLRIVVTDSRRAGLADDIRDLFPHAVDVSIDMPDDERRAREARPADASPADLLAAYLAESGVDDDRLVPAFEALLDELSGADS